MAGYKENLRKLTLNDERFVESVLGMGRNTIEVSQLDEKTHALVRLAALLAMDAALSSYQSTVELALATGASFDEIVGRPRARRSTDLMPLGRSRAATGTERWTRQCPRTEIRAPCRLGSTRRDRQREWRAP